MLHLPPPANVDQDSCDEDIPFSFLAPSMNCLKKELTEVRAKRTRRHLIQPKVLTTVHNFVFPP